MNLELLGLLASFVLIIGLGARRVPLLFAVLAGSSLLAATSGRPFLANLEVAAVALTDPTTLELALIVALVTLLARMIKDFGILEPFVASLATVLGSTRLALTVVPAIIGAMPVQGGAIISAPFVGSLGSSLSPERRSAVNLVFRHAWYLVFPYIPPLLLASRLAGVPIQHLIIYTLPVTAAILGVAYLTLLGRDGLPVPEFCHDRVKEIKRLLRLSSPILVSILLFLVLGIPLPLTLLLGLAIAWHIGQKPPGTGIEWLMRAPDYRMALTMMAIMIYRHLLAATATLSVAFSALMEAGVPYMALSVVVPLVVGFSTGDMTAAVGISVAILVPLMPATSGALPYVALLYVLSFSFYFVSPVHMCQVFSNKFFGANHWAVFSQYWPALASGLGIAFIIFFLVG
ncbi:MAG: DUF401 family protein [Bacillota bacterium]|jgi:integral membrane protein (TIGR00529 family)